ncbi:MAG: ATP-binding cassette domain-containing protein [Firmicutes bacterium]|nr:ATP-binding cassette domain-containing protein [Bacillota bacterium]
MDEQFSVRQIAKSYAGVQALQDVTIDFASGLTAIVGDNGAGKSTLMKILSGVEHPDRGTIVHNGQSVTIDNPVIARKLGIESLYQDLALADTLNVIENMFLGREIVTRRFGIPVLDERAMAQAAGDTLARVRIGLPHPKTPVRYLSGGQRQAVALARALYFKAQVLLLDEPTAALGPKETSAFTSVIKELVDSGTRVVMVTHNIPQVIEMADSIVVMRAGRIVARVAPQDTSEQQLLAFMVGSQETIEEASPQWIKTHQ